MLTAQEYCPCCCVFHLGGGGYAPQAVYALRQFMPPRQIMSLGLGQFFP